MAPSFSLWRLPLLELWTESIDEASFSLDTLLITENAGRAVRWEVHDLPLAPITII
jgi:hypothetical protein